MITCKLERFARILIAEVIGTSFLLIIGCFGCVDNFEYFTPSHITKSVGAGLALMAGINSFAAVSGGHINPVVSLAALVFKSITYLEFVVYLFAQLLGAIFGYSLVRVLLPTSFISNPESFCMNLPRLDSGQAVIIEFIVTFIMMAVVCAVWDPRNARYQDSAPLRIGLTVGILIFVAGNLSGGSLNPARSFGPAFYNCNWQHHWIYWIGPMLGSFTAAITFKKVLMEHKSNDSSSIESNLDEEQLDRTKQLV